MHDLKIQFIISLFVFLYLGGVAQSQSSADWDRVALLYESEKSFQWVRKWKGMLHEVHDIEIVLASQNDVVKGWCSYVKSKDTLFLEGTLDGQNLKLLESNKNGDLTGNIYAVLKNNEFEGEYRNKRDTYSWSLFLSEQSEGLNFASIKNLFYLRQYRNVEQGKELDLILTARNQNTISGVLYFLNRSVAYDCKGFKVRDFEYEMQLADFSGTHMGTAYLSTFPGNQKIIFNPKSSGSFNIPISMYAESTLEWLKHSSYESMIEVSYPKMEDNHFDDFAGKITSDWFESLTDLCEDEKIKSTFKESDWRNAVLGSSWFEPYFLSKTMVSGCFIMTNNRTVPKFDYLPITFSLEKEKDIDIRDEFKNNKRLDEIIFAEREKMKKTSSNDYHKLYNEWLLNQKFESLVITNGGIVAFSEYDIRFGLQKIFIPTGVPQGVETIFYFKKISKLKWRERKDRKKYLRK